MAGEVRGRLWVGEGAKTKPQVKGVAQEARRRGRRWFENLTFLIMIPQLQWCANTGLLAQKTKTEG